MGRPKGSKNKKGTTWIVKVKCDQCGNITENTRKNIERNKYNFCNIGCYAIFSKGRHNSPSTEYKPKEGSKHWKGGRTKCAGYIRVIVEGHPFANSRGYVAEHRLVMEKFLGRHLDPKEEIHHINGNKSDNRIENLHLFSTKGEHIRHHNLCRGK